MNEKIKKILKKDFTIGCLSVLIPIVLLFMTVILVSIIDNRPSEAIWHQYCIEDGDCKTGETLIIDGKQTVITKEFCLNNNFDWNDKLEYCKIR